MDERWSETEAVDLEERVDRGMRFGTAPPFLKNNAMNTLHASRPLTLSILSTACLALLSGCGGGTENVAYSKSGASVSGGLGSSTTFSVSTGGTSGTVTGLGSVVVDGERIDDSHVRATAFSETGATEPTEIKLGQQVEVQHQNMVASQLQVRQTVHAAVTAVNAAAGTFDILGQHITSNSDPANGPVTVFDGLSTFGDIGVGDTLKVFGSYQKQNDGSLLIRASRIERLPVTTNVSIVGPVSNLKTAAQTFQIGGLTVDFSGAPASSLQGLQNGKTVFVAAPKASVGLSVSAPVFSVAAPDPVAGKAAYANVGPMSCAACHGSAPSSSANTLKIMSGAGAPGVISQAIQSNVGNMGMYASTMTPDQIADVAAFLANPSGASPVTAPTPPTAGVTPPISPAPTQPTAPSSQGGGTLGASGTAIISSGPAAVSTATLRATVIKIKGATVAADEHVSGVLSNLTVSAAGASFALGDVAVTVSAATQFKPAGQTVQQLAAGQFLVVDGSVMTDANGVKTVAARGVVIMKNDPTSQQNMLTVLHGTVLNFSSLSSFVVRDTQVDASAAIVDLTHCQTLGGLAPNGLQDGLQVVVEGAPITSKGAVVGGFSAGTSVSWTVAAPNPTSGKTLYASCAGCHSNPKSVSSSPAKISSAIASNRGGMGMLSYLSADQIADIGAYMANPAAASTSVTPVTTPPTPAPTPGAVTPVLTGAVHGKALYDASCAACHNSNPALGQLKVLNGANNGPLIQQAINANTGGMGSSSLKALTAADLADIAAYIGNPASGVAPVAPAPTPPVTPVTPTPPAPTAPPVTPPTPPSLPPIPGLVGPPAPPAVTVPVLGKIKATHLSCERPVVGTSTGGDASVTMAATTSTSNGSPVFNMPMTLERPASVASVNTATSQIQLSGSLGGSTISDAVTIDAQTLLVGANTIGDLAGKKVKADLIRKGGHLVAKKIKVVG